MSTLRKATRPTLPARPPAPRAERRPFRDNPRLILLFIVVLIAALVAMVRFADSSTELNPDFLTEVVLYTLSAADLTILVALVFILARNIIKLLVERRRGLPFSRFRAKLVLALLGLTIVPCVLVLIVGSELIRSSTEKWFSQPIDDVLAAATKIAQDYYRDRESTVAGHATRIARALPAAAVESGNLEVVRRAIEAEVAEGRVGLVEVYRSGAGAGQRADVAALVAVESPGLPQGVRPPADHLASLVASGGTDGFTPERLEGGGELVRGGAAVRDASGRVVGVVLASDYLSGEAATHARQIIEAYRNRSQRRALRRPIIGVYLTLFVMMTLMILVGATWTGLYLAKRITRPVQLLAAGAREIGAGHLDHRIEPETRDEFGALVEAFNTMAEELAASQRKLERSRLDLERKNQQLDERRQYIETVLERIASGVVSLGPEGQIETINGAALRLLAVDRSVIGVRAEDLCRREDLQPLAPLFMPTRAADGASARQPAVQEVALLRDGRELHLAAAATPLLREDGSAGGAVLVFDDVTPLIRTQRVAAWRDVARRLAHEIKNPLTPIQLCAERMRRQFSSAPAPARALVDECTATIVGEVESLKALVDEFAQFARMPAPRAVPADLNAALAETLGLYTGLFREIRIEQRFAPEVPPVRVDLEQMRRVVINLVDNAVEALGGSAAGARPNGAPPAIVVETRHDAGNAVARILVSDNGPGISAADRDKLFMPYYSTKRRGSGLGLAIVRRIIAEHGGSIEVADHVPSGTVFTIELPT